MATDNKNQNSIFTVLRLVRHSVACWPRNTPKMVFVFCAFLCLALSALLTSALLLETPEGVSKIFSIINKQPQEKQLKPVAPPNFSSEEKPSQGEDVGNTPEQVSVNADAVIKQAEKITNILSPQTIDSADWIYQLKQERILDHALTIKLKPFQLNEAQKYILKVQGITAVPWPKNEQPPKTIEDVKTSSVLWVEQVGPKYWTVWGDLSVLTSENKQKNDKNVITNLEMVKIILWLDEWEAREAWLKANPAPEPPANLMPSNIGVGIIPSTIASRATFWLFVGALGAYFSMMCMTFSVISWEAARNQGRYEALSALPLKNWVVPFSFVLFWGVMTSCLVFVSLLFSSIFLVILNIQVPTLTLLFLFVLFSLSSICFISFAVMIASWYSNRSWRTFAPLALVLGNITLVSFYVKSINISSRVSINGFFSTEIIGFAILSALLTFVFLRLTGWRLSREGNLGLRIF